MNQQQKQKSIQQLKHWHTFPAERVVEEQKTTTDGLSWEEVSQRLQNYGPNSLPRKKAPSVFNVFIRQFKSPLIYILLIAGIVSLFIGEFADAIFIFVVVLLNAVIGTIQEYSSEKSAEALQQILKAKATVRRKGEVQQVQAEEVVPGDIVLLESGSRVPADIRLFDVRKLSVDESLLTGESTTVDKHTEPIDDPDVGIGDQQNMVFAGSTAMSGRGEGVVVHTGSRTELGKISHEVTQTETTKPPLVVRMERFVKQLSLIIPGAVLLLAVVSYIRGTPLEEVFFMAIALAVSAIPEGLPVSMTVALAISVNRMVKRGVIVRRLPAVEGLGSCTYIASDKTGTLTVNKQTARRVSLLSSDGYSTVRVEGEGYNGEGRMRVGEGEREPQGKIADQMRALSRAGVLCNEGSLIKQDDGEWKHEGDPVDVAFLALGYKADTPKQSESEKFHLTADIPFESKRKYAAKFYEQAEGGYVAVKGAAEKIGELCTTMLTTEGDAEFDARSVSKEAERLAGEGYRVLAVADGAMESPLQKDEPEEQDLPSLRFLGLVGFIDPLRPQVKGAVEKCRHAGVRIGMVTGDHPDTALAIAKQLGIADNRQNLITGKQLAEFATAEEEEVSGELVAKIKDVTVYARVSPLQKVSIIKALAKLGHFIAVTGDGVNDAPALRRANIGVAMGSGTDVTKDTGSIIVTDDNFASIVNGIEEGRYAYQNLRKVIYLLITTGAAEVILFLLALIFNTPLPLIAVQILWLNLVTNGIQDKALAFEKGDPDIMNKPPRDPNERIFNKIMIQETVIMGATMAFVSFGTWWFLLQNGWQVAAARNTVLLLMVIFENFHAFNCRSETKSSLTIPLKNNWLLAVTVPAAFGVHMLSLYVPFLQRVLQTQPITIMQFLTVLGLGASVMIVSEIFKAVKRG